MTEKLQYYSTDLSYLLGIGEIVDMHVVTLDNGKQVLRIECLEKKDDEYKTVKAGDKQKKQPIPKKPAARHHKETGPATNPVTLGDKLMTGAKTWFKNKEKPNFMKDAGF